MSSRPEISLAEGERRTPHPGGAPGSVGRHDAKPPGRPAHGRGRRTRWLVGAGGLLAALLAAALLLPLGLVVDSAFEPSDALGISTEQWIAGAGAGRAFRTVLETYPTHLWTSGEVALIVGALALALGVPAGVATGVAETRGAAARRIASAIEVLVSIPLGIPGLAVAMALLVTWRGRGGPLGLVIAGHVLYTLPFTMRTVSESARATQIDRLLLAARTLGASRVQRTLRVAWPALRRSVMVAALMALTISWGEFNATFLLATPDHGTFPTALYLTYTTNSFPVAAAATAIFLAGLVPLIGLALLIGEERMPEVGA